MLTVLLLLTPAAWGPSGCTPVGVPLLSFRRPAPVIIQAPPPTLMQAWRAYKAANAWGCSEACTCGCNEGGPCVCGNAPDADAAPHTPTEGDRPTGVDGSKVSARERITMNGEEVTRDEAEGRVRQLIDDSKKPFLVLIGADAAARRAMRGELLKDAGVSAAVRAQDYPPDAKAVATRYRVSGLTVYLLKPDGEEMVRADSLTAADAPSLLDRIKEALGLKQPAPLPPIPKQKNDPVIGPNVQPAIDALKGSPLLGWGLAALAALLWWAERNKGTATSKG